MPKYLYRACTSGGEIINGVFETSSKEALEDHLRHQGHVPLKVKEKREFSNILPLSIQIKLSGYKPEHMIMFTRQLRTFLMAGVPLLQAIKIVNQQSENLLFQKALEVIQQDVEGGSDFSTSLKKFPQFFSELYVGTVKAGESGGILPEALAQLADYLEYEEGVKRDIISALRYPALVLVGLVVACIVFTVFVLPKFAEVFSSFKVELPLATRWVFQAGTFAREQIGLISLAVIFCVMLGRSWVSTEQGRHQWDHLKLRFPIFGPLFRMVVLLRFSRMLQLMYQSGLSIVRALQIVSRTLNNQYYANEIEHALLRVQSGEALSSCLRDSPNFPPMVVYMVATGERTGSLDKMLEELASHYDMALKYRIKNMTVMIEPIVTVILAAMVLVLALAVFLPMWDLVKIAR